MSDRFLDANICVYAFNKSDQRKQTMAKELLSDGLCISSQVIIETYLACSRKLKMPPSTCEENTQFLCAITTIVPIDSSVFNMALKLKIKFQFSFLDAVIVAASLQANCTTLYSEDLYHGQKIETLSIINPFV